MSFTSYYKTDVGLEFGRLDEDPQKVAMRNRSATVILQSTSDFNRLASEKSHDPPNKE